MKTTLTIILSATLLFCLAHNTAAQTDSGKAEPTVPANSDSLNLLVTLCDSAWGANDSAFVKDMGARGSYPVRALATALLYRSDPETYGDQFAEIFAIHDYRERAEGKYDVVSQQEMLEELRQAENKHANIFDKRLLLLLMYDHFREVNKWVQTGDQKLSMSRFFRSAFLSAVFEGSDIDAVAIQSELDQRTEAQDLKK
jgi:hypothetical protein